MHRGDRFLRARAWGLTCAALALALLLAYAGTGVPALLPVLCLVSAAGLGAEHAAVRLANAALPRVRR